MSLTPKQRARIEAALETRGPKLAHEHLFNTGLALPYTTVKYVYDCMRRGERRCVECNKLVHYRSERCKSCAPKALAADPDAHKGGAHNRRPLPADFAERAVGQTDKVLRAHYRCHHNAIKRWRLECGVPAPVRENPNAIIPAGFKQSAPALTVSELRMRYGKSAKVIKEWLEREGVSPRRSVTGGRVTYKPAPSIKHVENSLAGRAVDECLQRFGPVYRCTPTGKPMRTGTHWNRGGRVLTDSEIIERAYRNGWKPHALDSLLAEIAA